MRLLYPLRLRLSAHYLITNSAAPEKQGSNTRRHVHASKELARDLSFLPISTFLERDNYIYAQSFLFALDLYIS